MTTSSADPAPTVENEKREAILDAALTLFAERGFYGTSVPDIARLAHVGAGTIYRYFEGKEALVNALYQQHKAELGRALLHGFDVDASPRASFHRFWHAAVSFAQNSPRAFQFLELHHHAPYLDAKSHALEADLLAMAARFIAVASERQIFKDVPPGILFAVVWGSLRTLVQGGCEGHLALTTAVVSQAEECVWEAIRR